MEFRKVKRADVAQTDKLFARSISDLLIREKVYEKGLLESEVARLQAAVQQSFGQSENLFFVTQKDGNIVGTIALASPGPFISSSIGLPKRCLEIVCVYVHPDYQRQGIGTYMLKRAYSELKSLYRPFYCLDAGFSSSQRYWKSVLGEPSFTLENYWGAGKPHMFWKRGIHEKS